MIPNNKKKNLTFFTKLYDTYGLGKSTLNNIYLKQGLNIKTYPKKIKKYSRGGIQKVLKNKILGSALKVRVEKHINFFFEIRTCKGMRHKRNYPIRGQRTRTNAKTKRYKKKKL